MKIQDLTRAQLENIVSIALSVDNYALRHTLDSYLLREWESEQDRMIDQATKLNILTQYSDWKQLQSKIDRHCKKIEFYTKLEV